ncbi:9717_t:CDS:1, partial [Gigaspora rosea]
HDGSGSNSRNNDEKEAQILQSTPVLTETDETQIRDELAALGYGNPESNDSSELNHKKPLVLLATSYDADTDGFTLVSYK